MKKSTEIFDELRSISPILAEIEKVNVFYVPEGYFIGLHEKIAFKKSLKDILIL